jgi:hypothetical protein
MKTPDWQEQTICKRDGFNIKLSFLAEDVSPRYHYTVECGWSEDDFEDLDTNFYWFTAKVTAYKGSIECGSTCLGGNAYKNLKEALGTNPEENGLGGYMPQLIAEAIENALTNLNE